MKINIGGFKGRDKLKSNCFKLVDIAPGSDYRVDIAFEPLPFNDNSVDAIYTSHTLEHILPERLDYVFSEMYRVLKAGRPIRIVVPDIDLAIKAYIEKDYSFLKDKCNPGYLSSCLPDMLITRLNGWFFTYYSRSVKADVKEDVIFGGHMVAYNWELLNYFLVKHGFKNVIKSLFDKGNNVFSGCDIKRYKNNSIYCEAYK